RMHDGNLTGVKPPTAASGIEGLLRYFEKFSFFEYLTILLDEVIRLFLGKEIVVVSAEQILSIHPQQPLACQVEHFKPQFLRILHEDHAGNVLQHGLEKTRIAKDHGEVTQVEHQNSQKDRQKGSHVET